MSKLIRNQYTYTAGERRAEKEIDTFLRTVNGPAGFDIMAELKNASL